MRVLFVCTANVSRSRTAEAVFRTVAEAERLSWEVRSAGTVADPSGRQLTESDVEWADLVCVMEPTHSAYVLARWAHAAPKVRVLGVPDIYGPGDPVLRDLLLTHIHLLLADHAR